MREKDAKCNDSQYAGGPWEPGAHGAGLALFLISLILQVGKSVPSARRFSLRGPTRAQTFSLVRMAQWSAGRQDFWRRMHHRAAPLLESEHCYCLFPPKAAPPRCAELQSHWVYLTTHTQGMLLVALLYCTGANLNCLKNEKFANKTKICCAKKFDFTTSFTSQSLVFVVCHSVWFYFLMCLS